METKAEAPQEGGGEEKKEKAEAPASKKEKAKTDKEEDKAELCDAGKEAWCQNESSGCRDRQDVAGRYRYA